MNPANILVIDDDPKIRSLLRKFLEGEGFQILEAWDEPTAIEMIERKSPDLITLDINLGSDDGFDLARKIRKTSKTPIIMVTGKDELIDRIIGLELGADDYITKPFHVREVLARIRSVLRRSTPPEHEHLNLDSVGENTPKSGAVHFDGMTAYPDRYELLDRHGLPCELTSGDFKLLKVFLSHPKRVLSRDRLMDLLDGPEWTPLDRTIDNQVARLRKKIERDPSNPRLIKTIRGIGYTFVGDLNEAPPQGGSKSA